MPASTVHTAAHEPAYARVRLDLSGFPAGTTGIQVVRRDLTTGKRALVRGARRITVVTPASDAFIVYDYEWPAGHPVAYEYYQFPDLPSYPVAMSRLDDDAARFTESAGGWVAASGSTAARSTAQALTPPGSLAVTSTGTGTAEAKLGKAQRPDLDFTCAPGQAFRFGHSARAATTGRTTQLVINWYDAAGAYILSDTLAVADNSGGFTAGEAVKVAPANARTWELFAQVLAPGGAGEVHYFDNFTAGPDESDTFDVAAVWLKHTTRPYLSRTVKVGTYTPYEHQLRAGVLSPVRRSVPIGGGDVRGGRRFTLTLKVAAADREGLDWLLAVGGILLYQRPGSDLGLPDSGYVQVQAARERQRGAPQSGDRWLELTLDEVSAPDADLAAAAVSWGTLAPVYATWADLGVAYATWAEVLATVASPSEVTVT